MHEISTKTRHRHARIWHVDHADVGRLRQATVGRVGIRRSCCRGTSPRSAGSTRCKYDHQRRRYETSDNILPNGAICVASEERLHQFLSRRNRKVTMGRMKRAVNRHSPPLERSFRDLSRLLRTITSVILSKVGPAMRQEGPSRFLWTAIGLLKFGAPIFQVMQVDPRARHGTKHELPRPHDIEIGGAIVQHRQPRKVRHRQSPVRMRSTSCFTVGTNPFE